MTSIIKTVTQVGTSSWTQISAGDFHAYAIRTGGGLFAWGKNDQGQLGLSIATTIHRSSPVQIGAGTWSVISAGNSFGAAITTAGNLQTTGLNNNGQQGAGTTVGRSAFTSVGSSSWTAVNAGATSLIGTTISNITFVWGTNTSGQLGLGDTANRSSPVQLGSNLATGMYQTVYPIPVIVTTYSNTSWTQVSVGDSFTVGLDNAGRLFAWGLNTTGQLGDGTTINTMPTKSSPSQIATTASSFTFINTSSPVQVSTGTSWNAVAAGGTHTVAVKSDGTLWSWGINTFGQVGSGSTVAQYVPKQVDILNSFTSVAAGNDFSVAINTNYSLWRWGFNSSTDIVSPHRSNALQLGTDSWNVISAGGNTAVVINSLGVLYGWGRITTDDGFAFNLPVNPITWAAGSSYTQVNAGDRFIHAIDSNYRLLAYGLNSVGQLGDSTTVTRSSPVQIGSVYNWSIIGGGIGATPMHAGALYLTGLNSSGQLGLGDVASRSSPVQLPATNQPLFNFPVRIGISRWSQISAGYSHSMAIRDDNTLWGWGLNASGQLGDSSVISRNSPVQIGTSSWIAISAGASHTSAIKLGDTLWSWGLNTRGQLGDNTTVNKSSPVQVGTGYWNNVTAGASHTTALADNNTLYIWGDDNFGQ
jgi:alpha-tubulin suppressor-like RCC1 family protein